MSASRPASPGTTDETTAAKPAPSHGDSSAATRLETPIELEAGKGEPDEPAEPEATADGATADGESADIADDAGGTETGSDDSARVAKPVRSRRASAEAVDQGPPPCGDQSLAARVEAVLLASDRPLTDARLIGILGLTGDDAKPKAVAVAVDELNEQYAATGRTFRIESVAGGRRMLTTPVFGPLLARLRGERQASRLSQAALETLAIIAYRQPILRADLEAIRGVACGEVLRGLMERRLVRITGRSEEPGRPMLYGTTREFLQVFGLGGLDDLPQVADLRSGQA